ncbi:MAG: alpha/beta fold hydrolase [Candidatus Eremiobacteraeota bacterium]|nr:alpha/beta fold hydrolase [Candidatus Eremiobacteraeota bacterium]
MVEPPVSRPASSYAQGVDRARAMAALDDDRILPGARTVVLTGGERRPWAVVLLHGLTNHPGQFAEFGSLLEKAGCNVIIPRMPKHGYADRLTDALASLTAEELIATTGEAIDIACGLGERVGVLGISMGGLLSAYFGQCRSDISSAVPVGPDFGLLHLPQAVTDTIAVVARALPNVFLWWDPRIKAAQRPRTAYPRFATHALMQTIRIGDAVRRYARTMPPLAGRIATVVNAVDPAVNNAAAKRVVELWRARRADNIEYIEYTDLPENHDIIDPDNPLARTDVVYPRLIDALGVGA